MVTVTSYTGLCIVADLAALLTPGTLSIVFKEIEGAVFQAEFIKGYSVRGTIYGFARGWRWRWSILKHFMGHSASINVVHCINMRVLGRQ